MRSGPPADLYGNGSSQPEKSGSAVGIIVAIAMTFGVTVLLSGSVASGIVSANRVKFEQATAMRDMRAAQELEELKADRAHAASECAARLAHQKARCAAQSANDAASLSFKSAEVQRVVKGSRSKMRRCYQDALGTSPPAPGKVTLIIKVAPNGSVRAVNDEGSTMSAAVVACMVDEAMALRFRRSEEGRVVKVPFSFVPKIRP